jgi:hypothetical protein
MFHATDDTCPHALVCFAEAILIDKWTQTKRLKRLPSPQGTKELAAGSTRDEIIGPLYTY